MGITVAIIGSTGEGKTTSTIINKDGSFKFNTPEYNGIDPKSHFIVNLDRKRLPFPGSPWSAENKNYKETSEMADIRAIINYVSKQPEIKSIALDTINLFLAHKEYNDRKKLSFDNWKDLANDIIEINEMCNTILRADQIAYIFGHVELITDINGEEKRMFSVIGKKSKRQPPESFYPIVVNTEVEFDTTGDNKYFFQTKAYRSSTKMPLGMISEDKIPNSLSLLDEKIRQYYGI